MAWNPEHKQLTRERILHSAAKLFTRDGYDNVGINDVMADAGLTRGAFYSHFSAKAELYAESIITSARQNVAKHKLNARDTPLTDLINGYLSLEHRSGEQLCCPLAFMITDITQRDEQVRDTYTRVFKGFVDNLQHYLDGEDADVQRQAMQKAVMMVGGVAIARALNDEALAATLLAACRDAALAERTPVA